MDVDIQYELVGVGWSRCTLDVYGQTCTVTASYLSDALGDLVDAVNHILAGGTEAKFSFTEEPGEYRWILEHVEGGAVSVRILEFNETWSKLEDSRGRMIYDALSPQHDFGVALLSALNELLDQHGVDGYKRKWGNEEFPVEGYAKLCRALGAHPSEKALASTVSLKI